MTGLLYLLSSTVVFLLLVFFAFEKYYTRKSPRITSAKDYPLPDPPPKVSVLIAARNEEKNIGACLSSLLNSRYPNLEIWVYEDRSTDDTRKILESFSAKDERVRVVLGHEEPPRHCNGKAHAMHQLVEKAHPSGEFWLSTDADTRHSPDGIELMVKHLLKENGDFLSIHPNTQEETFWERLVEPAIWTSVFLSINPVRSNTSTRPKDAVGYGPALFFRAKAYEKTGGYGAIQEKMLDDLSLAIAFRSKGFKTLWVRGEEIVSVRQYSSLAEIVYAWTKYFFPVLKYNLLQASLTISLQLLIATAPLATLLVSFFPGTGLSPLYGLSQFGIFIGIIALTRHNTSAYPRYAFFAPLSASICAFILLRSVFYHTRGKPLSWRGRVFEPAKPNFH